MTLEKSHCQATKRPNIRSVDARFLWIEGLTTFKNLTFRPPKCQQEALVILWLEALMPLEYPSSVNGITKNAFTKSMYL
jgi:hypothetical protein